MVTVSPHSSTNPKEDQGGCGSSAPTVLACHARRPDSVPNAAQDCTTLHVAAGPACNHSRRGGGSRIRNSRPPGLTVRLPSQKQTNSNGVSFPFGEEWTACHSKIAQSLAVEEYSRLRAGQLAITKTKNRQRGRFHK